MRENCTSGSVRGASGNRGSYRKSLLQQTFGTLSLDDLFPEFFVGR